MIRKLPEKHLVTLLILSIVTGLSNICLGQIRLAATGTSVTTGHGVDPSESFPSQLGVILGSGWSVGNFGEDGSTLMVNASFPYVDLPNYPRSLEFNPDVVIIEQGSNDATPNNMLLKADFIPDYSRLIDTYRALPAHPVIYVLLPIPDFTGNEGEDPGATTDQLINDEVIPLIRQVAALKNVTVIDLNTPLHGRPDLFQSDGMHPTAAGHRILAEVLARTLAAPVKLTATVASKSQINLTWADRTNESNFKIQRSTDNVVWSDVATVAANTTSYQDKGLVATTQYYYRVSATISVGSTVFSDTASAVTQAGPNIPSITSNGTAIATAATAFRYAITATHTPLRYNATGLPPGLTVSTQTGVVSGTPISSGVFNVTLSATNNDGTATKTLVLTVNKPSTQLPFNGTPIVIPGRLEMEQFDLGGQGIAYNDEESANLGGATRKNEGVDIETSSAGTFSVTHIRPKEWLKYSVRVNTPGTYTLQVPLASVSGGGTLHIEMDGVNISNTIQAPKTGSLQVWTPVSVVTPPLQTGLHEIRIVMDTVPAYSGYNFNMDYIQFNANIPVVQHAATIQGVTGLPFTDAVTATFNPTAFKATNLPAGLSIDGTTGAISGVPTQAGTFTVTLSATNLSGTGSKTVTFTILANKPFNGTLASIPGVLEAENFDLGGENVGYFDTDENHTGVYRPNDDVDIDNCDEGGFNIGGVAPTEWLAYTVNIKETAFYTLDVRIACPFGGRKLHVEVNGVNISGTINVPNTNGYQNWQTVTLVTPELQAGKQTLRVVAETGDFNLNKLTFTRNDHPFAPRITSIDNAKGALGAPFHYTIEATNTPTGYSAADLPEGLSIDTLTGVIGGTPTTAGTYTVTLQATNSNGTGSLTATFAIFPTRAFSGTPVSIPGTVEVEDFDLGGQGVGYFDTDDNHTGIYRPDEDVDLDDCSEGGFNIGGTEPTEWTAYTVDIKKAGVYVLSVRVASVIDDAKLHVELDGVDISGTVNIPNTNGFQDYTSVTVNTTALTTGVKELRVFMDSDGFNMNYLTLTLKSDKGPFTGFPISIPGIVEAENFDLGGQNVGYFDTDENHTGVYRPDEDVDIDVCSEGGFNIGGTETDEWMAYTVNVTQAGTYTLEARVASPIDGTALHVELDGVNISGTINIPNTNGFQDWQSVKVTTPELTTGMKKLRIVMESSVFNLNYLRFISNDNPQAGAVIPGHIEAEDYDEESGIETEQTGDVSGARNVSFIDEGDFMDYKVTVAKAGTYRADFRVASPSGAQLQVQQNDEVLATVDIPSTNDWQIWETQSATFNLEAGNQVLRVYAATGGWNFNWIDVTAVDSEVAGVDESTIASRLMVYPVPASHTLTVNTGDTMGNSETSYTVQNIITGSMYVVSAADQVLDISPLPKGLYVVFVTVGGQRIQKRFVKE